MNAGYKIRLSSALTRGVTLGASILLNITGTALIMYFLKKLSIEQPTFHKTADESL
ncbi:hypothetical protein EFK13_07215 [Bacillus cabrialesii]|uniref:hypothetical protein n=1 Tax=Bacillus cabrialesii TaxID=2487276 RepID=UPI0013757D07|nr:hypothetical protein [Bacillus cabrialesii]UQE80348.1 hypothetical protein EFK13_07215 [Bacillus cabrialesii]